MFARSSGAKLTREGTTCTTLRDNQSSHKKPHTIRQLCFNSQGQLRDPQRIRTLIMQFRRRKKVQFPRHRLICWDREHVLSLLVVWEGRQDKGFEIGSRGVQEKGIPFHWLLVRLINRHVYWQNRQLRQQQLDSNSVCAEQSHWIRAQLQMLFRITCDCYCCCSCCHYLLYFMLNHLQDIFLCYMDISTNCGIMFCSAEQKLSTWITILE